MLMVETELGLSEIHGIGVFLKEPVRSGQLIWRFDSRIDRVFSGAELLEMPDALQSFLKTYSTHHAGLDRWVLCGDNGRHFNHSDKPNTRSLGIAFGDDVAAEDLPAGTELTSDYRTICDAIRLHGVDFSHPQPASFSMSPASSFSAMSSR
jgi:SET domain-containing protein